eukprot:288734_1
MQINNEMIEITNDNNNKGWYDHEGDPNMDMGRIGINNSGGWSWMSIQLDNNIEICCSLHIMNEKVVRDAMPLNDNNNNTRIIDEYNNKIILPKTNEFVSHKSFNKYPD